VPLSLGTDTAGSGRVPAGLNNIVGLKPSLGLISTSGVVPACRSLDCVSIFALTTDDAHLALSVMAGHDQSDSYSRRMRVAQLSPLPPALRIAVPRPEDRKFFDDRNSEASFGIAIERARKLGMTVSEIDFSAFLETARLLYEGPWVAERYAAVGEFIAAHPGETHPVTREIVLAGNKPLAVDAFRAYYRLAGLRAKAYAAMAGYDALMVPTAPAAYTVEQLKADPVRLNSNLGTYTNFVNLLDMCGFAVPVSIASGNTPYGVTFLAPSGQDAFVASIGRAMHAAANLPLGALNKPAPASAVLDPIPERDEIAIAVVGAHLSGMPLNGELKNLGGRFLEAAKTARSYKLYALPGTTPPKPGMLKEKDGTAIELEIWALPPEGFGRFVAGIPAPLGIGTIELADGRGVKGFLVEASAVAGARDISEFGGWRAFMAKAMAPA
jgi:allophanate hydrolase